jgi:hypothetical protein
MTNDIIRVPGYPDADNYKPADRGELVSLVTMRQWRSNIVERIVSAVAASVMLADAGSAASHLGSALHALGDSFSASHTQRGKRLADGSASEDIDATTRDSCTATAPVLNAYSMDVVRWTLHADADGDRKSHKGRPLFTCLEHFTEGIIAAWAKAMATRGSSGTPKALLPVVNALVDDVTSLACAAIPVSASDLDRPAGGADKRYSTAAAKGSKAAHPVYPVGLVHPNDFDVIVRNLDDELVVAGYKEVRKWFGAKPAQIPLRYWLPRRNVDFCAPEQREALHWDAAEYAAQPTARPHDSYLDLEVRPFKLRDLGTPDVAPHAYRGKGGPPWYNTQRWTDAKARIQSRLDVENQLLEAAKKEKNGEDAARFAAVGTEEGGRLLVDESPAARRRMRHRGD